MNASAQFMQIAVKIIREQELIIGPLAWDEARKVQGINIIDQKSGQLNLVEGDQKGLIDKLVAQYERIFGKASREVCREAASGLLADLEESDIPASLK